MIKTFEGVEVKLEPGFYWAKLRQPSRMPANEDWESVHWEVCAVHDNNSSEGDPEQFSVSFPGIEPPQWPAGIQFGPRIEKPKELK